ncbi:MAG TPA: Rho termination factor N-terminal domain-containing protein [Thermoleophilaceae bacterium]|nr:Rho termination factor N-terminal domain-containing protein [Thermoleophilaceae bacterium]
MTVLQRNELEKSPLADLHAIASELGVEGFRGLRREDLVSAIVGAQGGDDGGDAPKEDEPKDEGAKDEGAKDEGGDDQPKRGGRRSRSRRGGRSRGPKPSDEEASGDSDGGADDAGDGDDGDDSDREQVSGVLDVLPNGSGFLRSGGGDENSDVYVSAAQIRRCELRGGDDVTGRMRPARRNEKHPSLVRVEQVNGRDAEPPEERPLFADLTAVHPTDKLPVPEVLGSIAIGKGSRVAVAGGPGSGATWLLRELVGTLAGAGGDLAVSVVLVGARPEEVTEWKGLAGDVPVVGGAFDESVESQTQAAELAVERAKRAAERGGDAVVVLDSLEALPAGAARRLFGAARKLEEGGSLTVVAATGLASEPQRQASTRVVLDAPGPDGTLQVSAERSGTLRADLIS